MMKKFFQFTSFLLMLVLLLAACAPAASNEMMKNDNMASDSMNNASMEEESMDSHDTDMESSMDEESMDSEDDMMSEDMSDEMSDDMSGDMMLPDWAYLESTNISSGETFTLADYQGKVVLVENLAMWCSTCFKQQTNVKELHQRLNNEDFISIGLDVDINETPEDLAAYIADNGFNWTYAVASQDLARGIANQFGANYLNPPLAPIFLIDRHGNLHQLEYGLKSVDDLEAAIKPLLEDM